MFKNLGNIVELMKQASRMRSEMDRVRGELERIIVEGSAAGGLVCVRVNGKHEVIDCKIDPQVFADKDAELLEDLIVAATNQALQKASEAASQKMKEAVGDVDSPAIQDALKQMGLDAPPS